MGSHLDTRGSVGSTAAACGVRKVRSVGTALMVLCAALVFFTVIPPSEARSDTKYYLDIPAQRLNDALQALALASQHKLLYSSKLIDGKDSPGLKGEYTTEEAVAKLLAGTNLVYQVTADELVVIRAPLAQPASATKTSLVLEGEGRQGMGGENLLLPQSDTSSTSTTGASASSEPAISSASRIEGRSAVQDELGEVIVTARRREEKVQDVPIAISVVSQQALQQNNIQTLGDLQYLVPSLSASTYLSRDAINVSIRGQGSNTLTGLPGVVSYLNEVPLPVDKDGNLAGGPGTLFDLEEVQVLKGPQGTLFGRNSVGGALLLQSARPKDAFGGHLQVGFGNYNDREIDGAINLPIVPDVLLARVAINGQLRDGFTRLEAEPGHPNGIDADNRDYASVRGTISFRPNEMFQNDTIVTASRYTSHGSPVLLETLNPTGPLAANFSQFVTYFNEQQSLGARKAIPVDTHLVSAGSNSALDNITRVSLGSNVTFRNILGFDRAKTEYAFDLDGSPLPLVNIPDTSRVQVVRQFSEEAQLLGKAFNDELDWVFGAFYLDSPPPNSYVVQTDTIFYTPGATGYRQGDRSDALYAQGTQNLSSLINGLELTLGARYTWDDRFFGQRTGSVSACIFPPAGTIANCPTDNLGRRDQALTWNASLDYHFTSATLLYVSATRGYRAGGYNFPSSSGELEPGFGPEFATNYETGAKSDWQLAGIPIRTNAAVYYEKYADIQVGHNVFNPMTNAVEIITENAAAAHIFGTEFEVSAHLTKNLQLGATFDYIDFKYDNFGPGVDPAPLLATTSLNAIPRKYGINASYHLPLGGESVDRVTGRINWNWQAASGDTSQPGGLAPSFGLLNMSLDWAGIRGTSFDMSMFISNALNETYIAGTFPSYYQLGFVAARYGEPRMFGVRLNYRFGEEAR
jgi:iron complex outermembrane recepter protein